VYTSELEIIIQTGDDRNVQLSGLDKSRSIDIRAKEDNLSWSIVGLLRR